MSKQTYERTIINSSGNLSACQPSVEQAQPRSLICFDAELAAEIGVNEAIFIERLRHLRTLPNCGRDVNGKHWIYNSIKQWREQFPFWSPVTIRRTIKSLVKEGVVQEGEFNKLRQDRTKWYTLDDDKLRTIYPKWTDHLLKMTKPNVQGEQMTSAQSEQLIPDNLVPDNLPEDREKIPTHKSKTAHSRFKENLNTRKPQTAAMPVKAKQSQVASQNNQLDRGRALFEMWYPMNSGDRAKFERGLKPDSLQLLSAEIERDKAKPESEVKPMYTEPELLEAIQNTTKEAMCDENFTIVKSEELPELQAKTHPYIKPIPAQHGIYDTGFVPNIQGAMAAQDAYNAQMRQLASAT